MLKWLNPKNLKWLLIKSLKLQKPEIGIVPNFGARLSARFNNIKIYDYIVDHESIPDAGNAPEGRAQC